MDPDPLPLHRLSRDMRHPGQLPGWRQAPVVLPALVILIGVVLRFSLLRLDARFHPDEALFAAQARLVSQHGDWLLRSTDLDKPPLTLWVTALSFRAFGPTEVAARLPNVIASGLSLAALYRLGWALYHDRAAAGLAVLLWALSPFDLAFAATVFTDIQATGWILVAAGLAARDRWRWAGAAAALGVACKLNALFWIPLVLALGLAANIRAGWRWRDVLRRAGWFLLILGAGIALLALWDQARTPRSFFALNTAHNNPGRLARSDELGPRLEGWAKWLGAVTGSGALNTVLVVAGALWLVRGAWRDRSRPAALDWLIAGFGLGFLAAHWLVAFNVYDRYIHTLVPFLLLIAGRALAGLVRLAGARPRTWALLAVALVVMLAPATGQALRGQAALGGDQGKHTGIDRLAGYLNGSLRGQVVIDHWLGWELAYYLGQTPGVTLVYAPLPEALADDMTAQAQTRYFAAPSAVQAAPWIAALTRADIHTQSVYHDRAGGFIVYRLDAASPVPVH